MADRNMASVYYKMPTAQLLVLRSKKFMELEKLKSRNISYLNRMDMQRLRQQIRWIDAVIFSREAQPGLI